MGVAQHLFMNTYRFNAAASAWFQKTPRGKEKVLRQMFTSKSMQPRQKDMPYHDVAQMMVLDRVVWATEEPTALYGGNQEAIPPQWDASLDEEPLTTTITDAIESCRNWPSTFATFMEGWKRREKEKEVPQMIEDVSISDPDALQVVYAHGNGSLKSDFYDAYASITRGLFNTRSRPEHTRKRKIVSHIFSQKSVLEFEPHIRLHVSELFSKWDRLYENALKGLSGVEGEGWEGKGDRIWFDCLPWYNYLALDIIC